MTYFNYNAGSYYGFTGSMGNATTGATRYTRSASSANINTMSRNIASGYSSDIEIIQKYLEDGKTDKAIEKYEALFQDVKTTTSNYNYAMTDSEVQSILNNAYASLTGTSMIDSIEANTSGSFWTGLKQSIPVVGWFCNDTSEAEALAKLAGDEVSFKDKALEFAGGAVGTLLFGALTGFGAFGVASKLLNAGEKTAKAIGVGTAIGSTVLSSSEAVL